MHDDIESLARGAPTPHYREPGVDEFQAALPNGERLEAPVDVLVSKNSMSCIQSLAIAPSPQ